MAGLFCSRDRRRFAPRPRAPSTFLSSPGARFALLPLLGAVTAAALPPVYVLPAPLLGFSGLLLAVRESKSTAGALSVGWAFGFGYFLAGRSEEHTSELQSLMRTSYAVFCLKQKKKYNTKSDVQTTIHMGQ